MPDMIALALMVQKFWPRLKFLKSRSKDNVKVTRSEMFVPVESTCTEECPCEKLKP